MRELGLQKNDVVNKWFMEHTPKKTPTKVKASELMVDDGYQRAVNQQQVNAIVKQFNWFLVNPVKVVRRSDGKHYIFDGQHTVKAIVKYTGNPDIYIECMLYEDIPYEIENALFSYQTGISRGLTVKDKFKADLQRNCPYAVDIKNVTDSLGLSLVSGGGHSKGVQIGEWIINIYNESGKDGLYRLLHLCNECFEGRFVGKLVEGVNIVLTQYADTISEDKLKKCLKIKGCTELYNSSQDFSNRYKCSLPKAVAYLIIEDYNLRYNVDLPRFALK